MPRSVEQGSRRRYKQYRKFGYVVQGRIDFKTGGLALG
jgi:hypothetical protein